jgi:hypothetical protein
MAKQRSASELARAWQEEKLEFNDALLQHLEGNLGLVPDPALVVGIGMAISWANMGLSDVALDLPGYPPMAVGEIMGRFGLAPFTDSKEQSISKDFSMKVWLHGPDDLGAWFLDDEDGNSFPLVSRHEDHPAAAKLFGWTAPEGVDDQEEIVESALSWLMDCIGDEIEAPKEVVEFFRELEDDEDDFDE